MLGCAEARNYACGPPSVTRFRLQQLLGCSRLPLRFCAVRPTRTITSATVSASKTRRSKPTEQDETRRVEAPFSAHSLNALAILNCRTTGALRCARIQPRVSTWRWPLFESEKANSPVLRACCFVLCACALAIGIGSASACAMHVCRNARLSNLSAQSCLRFSHCTPCLSTPHCFLRIRNVRQHCTTHRLTQPHDKQVACVMRCCLLR